MFFFAVSLFVKQDPEPRGSSRCSYQTKEVHDAQMDAVLPTFFFFARTHKS